MWNYIYEFFIPSPDSDVFVSYESPKPVRFLESHALNKNPASLRTRDRRWK